MKKELVLLLALLAILQSCVKDIYLDAGEEPKVVVECVLTEDSVQELYLSYTKGVSQKEADPLLEAEVCLIDLDQYQFSLDFTNVGEGKWILHYSALPGHHYRLEIRVPGHRLISAETQMPSFFEVKLAHYNPYWFAVNVIPSPFTTDGIIERINGYGYSGGSYYYNIPDRCWIYGINQDGSMADNICTNYPWVDTFNLIGQDYTSDTRRMLTMSEDSKPLTDEQDAFLYPVLIGEPLHDRFIRSTKGEEVPWTIVRGLWDHSYTNYHEKLIELSKAYQISGSFQSYVETETGYFRELGEICFEVLSEEYDKYLAAAYYGAQLEKSTEISKIYLRENIIETNIQGGLGIFGAKKRQVLEWSRYYSNIDYIITPPYL